MIIQKVRLVPEKRPSVIVGAVLSHEIGFYHVTYAVYTVRFYSILAEEK